MAPPIDPLGEQDTDRERRACDNEWIRTAAAPLGRLRPRAELRTAGRAPRLAGLFVRRRFALGARLDQARLQLAQERGVVCELIGELRLDPARCSGLVGELVELVRALIHDLVRLRHFFVGGSSPVATRQIWEAARRAAIVATAARPAYNPVQSSFLSMFNSSPLSSRANLTGQRATAGRVAT